MWGQTSEFGAIDLLGSLAVNAAGSHMAVRNPSLRVGIKDKSGDVPAWGDFRFLGGVAAAVAGQFGGYNVQRVANDVASGLLHSYVATETARRAAIARMEAGAGGRETRQISEQAVPAAAAAPAGARVGADYGW